MRPRAFTLVELLVVVSIVSVLVGLLLPALSGARTAARSAVCLSQIRTLQTASLMYADDRRGELIEPGLSEGGISPREELSWVRTLREYVDEGVEIRSPGDMSPHWAAEKGGEGVPVSGTSDRFRATSYGVNDMVTSLLQIAVQPGDDAVTLASRYFNRLSKVPVPAKTCQFLLMAEFGAFAGADHVHVQDWQSLARRTPAFLPFFASQQSAVGTYGGSPSDWTNALSFFSGSDQVVARRNSEDAGWGSASNYAFLDGHAATMRFSEVYESEDRNVFDPRLYR